MTTKQEIIDYIKNNEEVRNKFIETIVNRLELAINNNAIETHGIYLDIYLDTTYITSTICDDLQLFEDIKWLMKLLFGEQIKQLPKRMKEDFYE